MCFCMCLYGVVQRIMHLCGCLYGVVQGTMYLCGCLYGVVQGTMHLCGCLYNDFRPAAAVATFAQKSGARTTLFESVLIRQIR
jgi:hypothetical protein